MDTFIDPDAVLREAGAREQSFAPPCPPPEPRGRAYGRLRVLTLADAQGAPPRTYLLGGLMAPAELSLWWGAPKCGKSFLLLRIAYGLALGIGMWGRAARPCRVLYVAAEGEGGFSARLLALRAALGDAGDAFRYIAQRVVVGPPSDDLEDLIRAAREMRADLVVLDTVARTFGAGDENAAKDMGGFVAALDRLRTETADPSTGHPGAHVVVIHHGRRDGANARGSVALEGAADLIVKVARGRDGEPSLATVEAAKDDVDGAALPFRLHVVELDAEGSDGEPRQTCVAEEAEESDARRTKANLSPTAKQAVRCLADAVALEGEGPPPVREPTG